MVCSSVVTSDPPPNDHLFRYQLIYAMGQPRPLPERPERIQAVQGVLRELSAMLKPGSDELKDVAVFEPPPDCPGIVAMEVRQT